MPSLAVLALAGLAVFMICALATRRGPIQTWWLPAALSAAFFAYSLWPILTLGLLGFWTEHVRNQWGVQIWFDLLCAIGVGWALLVPRARAVGIAPWPCLALIVATGSIGLLAMLARVLKRESATPVGTASRIKPTMPA